MNEIYYCRIIWKERASDINKGDMGWIEDFNLEEVISRARIFKADVASWEEYKEPTSLPYYHNKESKVKINLKKAPNIVILCKLEEFDKIMESYYNSIVQFRYN